MNTPKISIVIPVYNGANYMREAIDSALAQTYQNTEVIVVNDGSNDNGKTDAIARSYGERIRYFAKPNGGVSSALNFGIQMMRGEYFSWLSHDDVYELNKVEKAVEQLRKTDEKTLVCCGYSQINERGEPLAGHIPTPWFRTERTYHWQETMEGMLKGPSISGCSFLIPKSAFAECGGFDETLRFCQDTVMWYRIFMQGYSLRYVEDAYVKSRIHGKQLTQTGQALFREESERLSIELAEMFGKASDKRYNFIKMYAENSAKYLTFRRVKQVLAIGRKQGLFTPMASMKIYIICLYGKVRPLIRKLYYKMFRGIQTD